jgi:hypothetical protein
VLNIKINQMETTLEKTKSTQDKILDNLFELKKQVQSFTNSLENFKNSAQSSATIVILDAIITSENYNQMKEAANVDLTK